MMMEEDVDEWEVRGGERARRTRRVNWLNLYLFGLFELCMDMLPISKQGRGYMIFLPTRTNRPPAPPYPIHPPPEPPTPPVPTTSARAPPPVPTASARLP